MGQPPPSGEPQRFRPTAPGGVARCGFHRRLPADRARRTQRAMDIARERGHTRLLQLLEPVVVLPLPSPTDALEHRFHSLHCGVSQPPDAQHSGLFARKARIRPSVASRSCSGMTSAPAHDARVGGTALPVREPGLLRRAEPGGDAILRKVCVGRLGLDRRRPERRSVRQPFIPVHPVTPAVLTAVGHPGSAPRAAPSASVRLHQLLGRKPALIPALADRFPHTLPRRG